MQPRATKLQVQQTKIHNVETPPCSDEVKANGHHTSTSYLDLYVIGKVWVDALSTGLVGDKVEIIPVVKADKTEEPSQKPQPMKYQDLPMHNGVHAKDKEDKQGKICPDQNERLLHRSLYPHVKYYRAHIENAIRSCQCYLKENCAVAKDAIKKKREEIRQTIRDPENAALRYAVVTTGGVAGYLFGTRVNRRKFWTFIGLIAGSSISYPQETDKMLRNVVFCARKTLLDVYNTLAGDEMKFREKVACKDELPPPPPEASKECPVNK